MGRHGLKTKASQARQSVHAFTGTARPASIAGSCQILFERLPGQKGPSRQPGPFESLEVGMRCAGITARFPDCCHNRAPVGRHFRAATTVPYLSMMTSYRNRDIGRTAVGLTISLLLHASLFLFFRLQTPKPLDVSGNSPKGPLIVELKPQEPLQKTAPPVQPVTPPAAAPATPPRPPKPAARKQAEKKLAEKKPAMPRPSAPSRSAALPRAPDGARPTPQLPPDNTAPPADMSEMVAAARARRRAAGVPVPEDPPANDAGASQGDEVARANIARSIAQARGPRTSGGVFQITHKGVREAEFLFRGWDNDSRASARQLVRVDAGANGDVEDAIVRRMIQIIRERQSGDFSWNSYRLGRVVVLSARREDNAGLMDFLKQEFFGSGR